MRLLNRTILLFSFTLLIFSCKQEKVGFNEHVRPILNKSCISCHGGVKRSGGIGFVFRDNALVEGASGKRAIIPGDAKNSELYKRIVHHDEELRMPLEKDRLTKEEIALIKDWIDQGAEWEEHWSYTKPDKNITPPEIEDPWIKNDIDKFVLRKIEEKEFTHNKVQAPKEVLVRRLYLDIIGVPPTVEEANSFINSTDSDIVDKTIDELLSRKEFGEKWASWWMDLARYGDSKGYQADRPRDMWPYRDWLIKSLNNDMPFDQFTIEQLAGDLLEDPTHDQLVATAFHRNTMINEEGGTDDEEFRVVATLDRVNTTYEAWQSLTIGCVQCHSHPYDPIVHKEYYTSLAYFNNTQDCDQDPPLLPGKYMPEGLADSITDLIEYKISIMQEMGPDTSRITQVFNRGNWLDLGEEVQAGVPSLLKGNKEVGDNRLGLAKWLVGTENPLTSRVMVNRIWEQIFGLGIVETVEDLGSQGDLPSHPELLDWLAVNFSNDYQWSLKSLIKEIVSSATYAQSSVCTLEEYERDPKNKYLTRGSRFRLTAEQVRDQALHASGLLSKKMYGPSIMPPQPDGVWSVINNTAVWEESTGEDKYRRGVYIFWRKSVAYPSFVTFDSPDKTTCTSRRIRTNTPLQAFVTLNDPVYTEAAEHLAQRAIDKHGNDLKKCFDFMYYTLLYKNISDAKVSTALKRTYDKAYAKSKGEGDDSETSHKKAMFLVGNVVLNLDEVLAKN